MIIVIARILSKVQAMRFLILCMSKMDRIEISSQLVAIADLSWVCSTWKISAHSATNIKGVIWLRSFSLSLTFTGWQIKHFWAVLQEDVKRKGGRWQNVSLCKFLGEKKHRQTFFFLSLSFPSLFFLCSNSDDKLIVPGGLPHITTEDRKKERGSAKTERFWPLSTAQFAFRVLPSSIAYTYAYVDTFA